MHFEGIRSVLRHRDHYVLNRSKLRELVNHRCWDLAGVPILKEARVREEEEVYWIWLRYNIAMQSKTLLTCARN